MSRLTAYDTVGIGYAAVRKPDARLAAVIGAALGGATTVVNIGAGTGGYEPSGRAVIAVEPSSMMLSQRSPGSAPAVQAIAEALPLADHCADAAMAVLTVAHWADLGRGLDEMRRVARRVVIITVDPDVVSTLWIIADYVPEMIADVARLPAIAVLVDRLPGAKATVVPSPLTAATCSSQHCGRGQRPTLTPRCVGEPPRGINCQPNLLRHNPGRSSKIDTRPLLEGHCHAVRLPRLAQLSHGREHQLWIRP